METENYIACAHTRKEHFIEVMTRIWLHQVQTFSTNHGDRMCILLIRNHSYIGNVHLNVPLNFFKQLLTKERLD